MIEILKVNVYCNLQKQWLKYNYCLNDCEFYDKHNQECDHFGEYTINPIKLKEDGD